MAQKIQTHNWWNHIDQLQSNSIRSWQRQKLVPPSSNHLSHIETKHQSDRYFIDFIVGCNANKLKDLPPFGVDQFGVAKESLVQSRKQCIQPRKDEEFSPNQLEDGLFPSEKHLFEACKDAQTCGFVVVIGVNAVALLLVSLGGALCTIHLETTT